jgi:TRAP-type C4-dicarboxylate transport system permease small subunit
MLALLCWFGVRMAWDDFDMEVTSPGLGAPQWLYTVWLPILSAAVIARIVQGFVHVWRQRDRAVP